MVVQACVNCHNTIADSPRKDWKLGDVRGVLEVTSVIDAELANGAALSRSINIGAVLIGLGLLAMALLVAGSVTRPIENLIGAMQKVAAGNFETVSPASSAKMRSVGSQAASTTWFLNWALRESVRSWIEPAPRGCRLSSRASRG
jgi:hypothetical protein